MTVETTYLRAQSSRIGYRLMLNAEHQQVVPNPLNVGRGRELETYIQLSLDLEPRLLQCRNYGQRIGL